MATDEVSGKEVNFDGQAGKLQKMRVGLRPHTPSKAPFPVAGLGSLCLSQDVRIADTHI